MKFKWTYLFIIVVLALVGFTVFDYRHSLQVEEKEDLEKRVLNFEPGELTEIVIEAKGETKTLKRILEKTLTKDEQQEAGVLWQVTTPFEDSADQQVVNGLIESFSTERIQEVVQEGEDLNLKNYGLDAPLFKVTLVTPKGPQVLKIGSIKAYDGSLFAKIEGQKRVVLVSSAWDIYLSKPARELRDKHVYRRDPKAKAQRVLLVSNQSGHSFQLEFQKNEKDVWVTQGLGRQTLRDQAVDSYVETVKALRAIDDKSIGFDKPAYSISIWFEGQEKPFELKLAKPSDAQNIETLSSDLPHAVAVYKIAAQKVMVSPQNFYDPKAPFAFQVNQVARIKINAPDLVPRVKVEFQKTEKGWEKGLQTPADSSKLNEFVARVSRLEAVRFYDSKSSPAKETMKSSLEFFNAKGDVLFELRWGETRTEKALGEQPEAVVLPVRTNKALDAVALPEASLTNLGLEKL